MNDIPAGYAYDASVDLQVNVEEPEDFYKAADFLNAQGVDAVCLQHEYGIFGPKAGFHILHLLRNLRMPVVTTLHTILENPSDEQKAVMDEIVELSQRVVVMSQKGRSILLKSTRIDPDQVDVIPHGCPDVDHTEQSTFKSQIGLEGRKLILTFGLLSPDKGIESAIKAMAGIAKDHPDATYLVLGATHPHILKSQGDGYRESLESLTRDLGLDDHIRFENRYVDLDDLMCYLRAADVYLTPYLNPKQITSGTLAYAFGAGRAIVSTPYWHAEELLAEGRGRLIPFGDSTAITKEVSGLLSDQPLRKQLEQTAYWESRRTTWPIVGGQYLKSFEKAIQANSQQLRAIVEKPTPRPKMVRAVLDLSHLRRLTDDTGIIQHATRSIPLRREGYCVDDNARALLLMAKLPTDSVDLATRYLSFIVDAYVPASSRFHNFMSYARQWLDEAGSEDSHGRCLWALGAVSSSQLRKDIKDCCRGLFDSALCPTTNFSSPRAWAFSLLGMPGLDNSAVASYQLQVELSNRLMSIYELSRTTNWEWFEESLSYDNARLSHGLLAAGRALNDQAKVHAGLKTLNWLNQMQADTDGRFMPIGCDEPWRRGTKRPAYDQQPVDAWATVDANMCAFEITGDEDWRMVAKSAYAWFHGHNRRSLPLYDAETGGCRDGLQPHGLNANEGAESTLSYLLATVAIRELVGADTAQGARCVLL